VFLNIAQTALAILMSATKYLGISFAIWDYPAVALLEDMNPDELSPKQALELLYRLKGWFNGIRQNPLD